jgi:DNA-binding CsgD family transcriptional regulator
VSQLGLEAPPVLRPLSTHQLDTLRLYQQLGSYQAVADYRDVSVAAVDNTLRLARIKLGVATSAEALAWLREHPHG